MVVDRKIVKSRYLLAFIISAGIFLLGILIGYITSENKISYIDNVQQDLRTQLLEIDTQYDLALQNPCNIDDSLDLTKELYQLSDQLGVLEKDLGSNNQKVLNLVNYYSLIETKHWLFMKESSRKCNSTNNLVLFFYSNDENICADCSTQGYVLTYTRKKYPENNIYVYSFNYDLDNSVVNTLKRMYNITSVPSLVINDKTYYGLKNSVELEKIIGLN